MKFSKMNIIFTEICDVRSTCFQVTGFSDPLQPFAEAGRGPVRGNQNQNQANLCQPQECPNQ